MKNSQLSIGSLNTWSNCIPRIAGQKDEFIDYLVSLARSLDILCLQEVHFYRIQPKVRFHHSKEPKGRPGPLDLELGNRLVERLKKTHHWYFTSHFENAYHDCEATDERISYGNLVFIKKGFKPIAYNSHPIYSLNKLNDERVAPDKGIGGTPASRSAQIFTVMFDNEPITIEHVHGLWSRSGKVDIPARTAQSAAIKHGVTQHRRILKLDMNDPAVLIIGDLNKTSAMKTLQEILAPHGAFGMNPGLDLNKGQPDNFNRPIITDTRTKWYPSGTNPREADYALVSQKLEALVHSYMVDPKVSSDHALLLLTLQSKTA